MNFTASFSFGPRPNQTLSWTHAPTEPSPAPLMMFAVGFFYTCFIVKTWTAFGRVGGQTPMKQTFGIYKIHSKMLKVAITAAKCIILAARRVDFIQTKLFFSISVKPGQRKQRRRKPRQRNRRPPSRQKSPRRQNPPKNQKRQNPRRNRRHQKPPRSQRQQPRRCQSRRVRPRAAKRWCRWLEVSGTHVRKVHAFILGW